MEVLLQNPFSITLLVISMILILLVFNPRIHEINEKAYPDNISCPECNKKIKRSKFGKKFDTCPFCHEKLKPNRKRLACFCLGIFALGLSLFFGKESRWMFQLIYITLTFIGFSMKEFEKSCN